MAGASLQFVPDTPRRCLRAGASACPAQERRGGRHPGEGRAPEPAPEYRWTLADALRQVTATTRRSRSRQPGAAGAEDPRTLAIYLSTRREDSGKAVDCPARLENRGDVFTLDALAWALARSGKSDDASALMSRALAEGTQDGRLFLHAAVIAAADGRPADAARWARKARALRFTLLPSELGVLRAGL
jgi:hypothetical protein